MKIYTAPRLQDIATTGDIAHLLKYELILEKHIIEEPAEVRELSDKETEVEFSDGLDMNLAAPNQQARGFILRPTV